MAHLQLLDAHHAPALLQFELDNREFFARWIPDRGDDYFQHFAERHAALLADQAAGLHRFHVLVDHDGTVLGRFNLIDIADGCAELGYRMAERATGRGLAKEGVRQVCELAYAQYGLRRLIATAGVHNKASLAVLRGTGFERVAETDSEIRHVRVMRG